MKNVLALVLAGGRVDELSVLTLHRPKSAVPFGGVYRVIDFPLSNLMHSGVERVGILSQYRSFSLINHIGIGSWWDFVGRNRGATILPPSTGSSFGDWYRGTADAVYQNLEFVHYNDPETILILSGDHIYKMNYRQVYDYHREKGADLTVVFYPIPPEASHRFGVADLDDEDGEVGGRVLTYREKPKDVQLPWASLTIYLFRPEVLYAMLEENARDSESQEFGRDIIPRMVGRYRVYGYKFRGYWSYSRTIDEYWQTNMELLGPRPKIDLEAWEVRTNLDHDRLRDRSPAEVGPEAVIENSLVYNGCRVDGEVRDSILFPGARVARGAKVHNSILIFDTTVEEGAVLDKVITDAHVRIDRGCHIGQGEDLTANRRYPELLSSGITLIGRATYVPPEVRIGRNCIVYPALEESHFPEKRFPSGVTI